MSEKRNRATSSVKEKYIAFIDSDAYPVSSWLINGINILKKNNKKEILSYYSEFQSELMKAAKKGAIKKKNASRKISRTSKKIKNLKK